VEFPIGHKRRRAEGIPFLQMKFEKNLSSQFGPAQVNSIVQLCADRDRLGSTPVHDFMSQFVP
jgi:2-methylcitrate dehydratase